MAQIKAEQVKLVAEGDLIIGDAGANSSILSIGAASQVVISNGTTGAWDYLEDLRASGTGELIIDGIGIGSAVNHLKVTNSITGNPVLVECVGADTNINLELTSKGTGRLKLDGTLWPDAGVAARSILATQNGAPDDLVAITSPDGSGDQILLYNDTTNTLEWTNSVTFGVVKYDDAVATGAANESFVSFFSFTPLSDEAITVFFNGLALRDTGWTRSGSDLTLVDSINDYSTESDDIISSRYETVELAP